MFDAPNFDRLLINRSSCLRHSGIKRRSRSRMCDCSRNARAQRGIARSPGAADGDGRSAKHHQPITYRRAAGPRCYSRKCRGDCGIDDVLLRLREGKAMSPRAHLGPYPLERLEMSIDQPHYRGYATITPFTFPTSLLRTISQCCVLSGFKRTS